MNTTKANYIYIAIERSLYLNVSFWIILTAPSDIFNKMGMQ